MATRGKDVPLSITLRTIDRATEGIRRVHERLERMAEPPRRISQAFARLGRDGVAGLRSTLGAIGSVTARLTVLAGAAGLSAAGLRSVIDSGDRLAKTADRLKVPIDSLAGLRHAAEQAGVASEELDGALEELSIRLGEAKAGEGSLHSFLETVSPELLKQMLAASSSEEAFLLLADAMTKLDDPAKRAALASAAFSDQGVRLINLLGLGSKGVRKLQEEYLELAGSQEQAARDSETMHRELGRVMASLNGVRATLLTGLAPAFVELSRRVTSFLTEHRDEIAAWASDFGEKLPDRIETLIGVLKEVGDTAMTIGRAIGSLVELVGGAENAVKLLVAAFVALKGLELASYLASVAAQLRNVAAGAAAAAAAAGGGGAGRGGRLGRALGRFGLVGAGAVVAWEGLTTGTDLLAETVEEHVFGMKKPEPLTDERRRELALEAALEGKEKFPFSNFDEETEREIDERIFWYRYKNKLPLDRSRLNRLFGLDWPDFVIKRWSEEWDKLWPDPPDPWLKPSWANAPQPERAEIKVSFENAPKGMRATVEPGSTANVDLSVGRQMVTP